MAIIKKKVIEEPEEEEEELEEFIEDDEDSDEEELPKLPAKKSRVEEDEPPQKKAFNEAIRKVEKKPEPVQQPQYVAVPRVVSIEAMVNELYDTQQEMRQILTAILEKIK